MRRKQHKKSDFRKILIIGLIIAIIALACFAAAPRKVVIKHASFGEPGSENALYFTLVNGNFIKKECTLMFSVESNGNESITYYNELVGARQKLARNITFEMPSGDSKMNLNISCR